MNCEFLIVKIKFCFVLEYISDFSTHIEKLNHLLYSPLIKRRTWQSSQIHFTISQGNLNRKLHIVKVKFRFVLQHISDFGIHFEELNNLLYSPLIKGRTRQSSQNRFHDFPRSFLSWPAPFIINSTWLTQLPY